VPAGWSLPSGVFSSDVEVFVVKGEIKQREWRLRKHA
jgi:hypothetical protein